MNSCERCGARLRLWALVGAVAEGVNDILDGAARTPKQGLVSCLCGAVYRHRAPAALAFLNVAASAVCAFLLLRALAGPLDRLTASWNPYWQGAVLLAAIVAPALAVLLSLALAWPVRLVSSGAPRPASRLTTALLFEYSLILALSGMMLALTQGFGPLAALVLVTALVCFWMSGRPSSLRAPR